MSISYEGIGEWCATFVCGAVSEGDIVKVSANGTVGKCTAGGGAVFVCGKWQDESGRRDGQFQTQLLEDFQQGIQIGHRFKGFDPCHRGLRNAAPRCQLPLAQSHRIALLYHCFHDCRHCFRFPDILCNFRVSSCHMLLIIVPGPHIHSPFLASQSSRSAFARSISRRGVFCDFFRNWCSSTNRSPRQQK